MFGGSMKPKVRVFDLLDDPVNHPSHYTSGGIECIDAMAAMAEGVVMDVKRAWMWLSAFKYIWRWPRKDGLKDLRKAHNFIGMLIEATEELEEE